MKTQCSFRIDSELIERVRNAVHHNRGAPRFLTLDGFVNAALEVAARKLERENGGLPFAEVKRASSY